MRSMMVFAVLFAMSAPAYDGLNADEYNQMGQVYQQQQQNDQQQQQNDPQPQNDQQQQNDRSSTDDQ